MTSELKIKFHPEIFLVINSKEHQKRAKSTFVQMKVCCCTHRNLL